MTLKEASEMFWQSAMKCLEERAGTAHLPGRSIELTSRAMAFLEASVVVNDIKDKTPLAAKDQQIHDRELATASLSLLRQLLGHVQAGKSHGHLQDILRREIREMENLQRTGERTPGTLAVEK